MALTTGSRIAHYEVTSSLGAGGMGEVFRATDTRLNRDVAIKTLPDMLAADPERVARFRREAQFLAALNHPNVAAIYGFEETATTRALVMELVDGPTLADRLSSGPLALDEALTIAKQIVEAVEYAHEQGVVHRDLKPANIKLTSAGTVKVLDFGLAKAFGPAEASPAVAGFANSPTLSLAATQAGLILGTAAYMSPEQAKGKPVDRRADIWSFGIVLFEMLSGRMVYSGETVSDTMAAVLMKDPEWELLPATTPPRLRELLRRCLVKDPRHRLQAMGEARIALDEALRDPVAQVVDVRPQRRQLSGRVLVMIAASTLAVGGAAAYAAWRFKPDPPRELTRFTIELPQDERFSNSGRQVLAISPDGTTIAFGANQKLYIRPLSELEPRVVPGGDAATARLHPVFSPDGREIAFFTSADNTIKRLTIAGGSPVTVGRATAVHGLEWQEYGLLFGQRTGIARLSPAGGTPEIIVPAEPDKAFSSPQFLPGGRAILFSIRSGTQTWDEGEVVVQPLEGGPRKTIVNGGSDGRYLPTGHLTYSRAGVLLAAPFDISRLELLGPPVSVLEGVRRAGLGSGTGATQYEFSSTGTLAYWDGPVAAEGSGNDLAIFDRKNTPAPLKLPRQNYRAPRVAPDGKFVAVETEDDQGGVSIWIYELSGASNIRRLTLQGSNRGPVWSADSQWIFFQSDRDGDAGLYRQRADGSGVAERLTKTEPKTTHSPQAASPDGAWLLFSVATGPLRENATLWTLSLRNQTMTQLAGIRAREAAFSPDGRWIVYEQLNGVFLEPFPQTGAKYQVSERAGHPFWSPKGDEVFLNSGPGRTTVIPIALTPTVSFGRPVESSRGPRFEGNPTTTRRNVDLLPSGEFLGVLIGEGNNVEQTQRIRVVLNWFEELRARVPIR